MVTRDVSNLNERVEYAFIVVLSLIVKSFVTIDFILLFSKHIVKLIRLENSRCSYIVVMPIKHTLLHCFTVLYKT